MKTITQWLRRPVVFITLAILACPPLILLGRSYELSKSDWAAWVGSVGTVATLIGTIVLATSEQRRRLRVEKDLAVLTVAALTFRISMVKTGLDGVGAILLSDMTAGRVTDYRRISAMISQLPVWTAEEVVPLVEVLPELAARLAFAAAEIDGVRRGIEMAAGIDLYAQLLPSQTFNAITLPRINSPVEALIDCSNRCTKYLDETGFNDHSPTDPH